MNVRKKSPSPVAGYEGRGSWERVFSRPLIPFLLLVAITLVVYWPARLNGFLGYDDPGYYSENAHVLGGFTRDNVIWALTTGEEANWHPLTWWSLMLDAEIFGNQPAGPHLVNLLWHAVNSGLLFLVLFRLTSARWRSAVVALVFAVHPLHVESVAWIAERKDLLCAFFMLLAILCYGRYGGLPEANKEGRKTFYRLTLACFVFSLLSKPMAVTLPFLLLLLDWWPLGRWPAFTGWRQAWSGLKPLLLEKVPFLILSVAASVVTFVVQKHGAAVETMAALSLPARVDNAFVSYARYLGKIFWPATLANPYPHPDRWPGVAVAAAVLLFVLLSVAAVWRARKWPFLFTGWFWFVGMLVPVIGLVQVGQQAMADRYAYLPMAGVLVAVVWGVSGFIPRARWSVIGVLALTLALLTAGAVKTRMQLSYWRDDGALFGHALAATRDNFVAHVNYGVWLSKHGQTKEALAQYSMALQLNPKDSQALYNLGNTLSRLGRPDEAVADYRQALLITPDKPEILNNLGLALAAQKLIPEAITNYEAALRLKPEYPDAHNNLGNAYFKQGRFRDAAEQYYAALKLTPDNPILYANLGDTMVRSGRRDTAAECYKQALQLDPGNQKTTAKLDALRATPAP